MSSSVELEWAGPSAPDTKTFSSYNISTVTDVIKDFPSIKLNGNRMLIQSVGKRDNPLTSSLSSSDSDVNPPAWIALSSVVGADGTFCYDKFADMMGALAAVRCGVGGVQSSDSDEDEPAPPAPKQPKLETAAEYRMQFPDEGERGNIAGHLMHICKCHNSVLKRGLKNDVGKDFLRALLQLVTVIAAPEMNVVISTTMKDDQDLHLEIFASHRSTGAVRALKGVADVGIFNDNGELLFLGEIKSQGDERRGVLGEGQLVAAMLAAFINRGGKPIWGVSLSPQVAVVYEIRRAGGVVVIVSHGSTPVGGKLSFAQQLFPFVARAFEI